MKKEDFIEKHCRLCGTQRCGGPSSIFAEGCRFYIETYIKKVKREINMKEIFEIDMKGNAGATIAEIVSFSKQVNQMPIGYTDLPTEEEIYEIHIKYKSGSEETLKFRKTFQLFKADPFGDTCEHWGEVKK